MRKQEYRVAELHWWLRPDGIRWWAWLIVHGARKAIHGSVEDVDDLDAALTSEIARVYEEIVGSPLPDPTH